MQPQNKQARLRSTHPVAPARVPKSSTAAGFLQFFFGWFGAGRFYYGHPLVGITQLAIGVTGILLGLQPARNPVAGTLFMLLLAALSVWVVIEAIMMWSGAITAGENRAIPTPAVIAVATVPPVVITFCTMFNP